MLAVAWQQNIRFQSLENEALTIPSIERYSHGYPCGLHSPTEEEI